MNARFARLAALLALIGASLGFAQSGFVPAGSIVIDCEAGCRIGMSAFGLVEVAEPQETVVLGGLPGGTYDLRIVSDRNAWDLTVTVCGTATVVHVVGGEATVEPPRCAPFGFLAVTLPPGARAQVAQRTLRASTTAALYVGVYDVVFTKVDGEQESHTVVVSEGATTEVGLAPPDATATFLGVPLDAIIRFSRAGTFEGPGPHVVAPGLYVVEIDAPGFAKVSYTLLLEAGAQLRREVQLEPLPPGYARLLVTPPTATIEIAGDAYYAGDAIPLPPGEHTATVTAPGYETGTVTVTIISAATSTVEVRLRAILGRLVLRVEPRNAVVQIAGNTYAAGETIPLAPGDYLAIITAPGYETVTERVTITAEATSTLEVRLSEMLGRLVLRIEPRTAVVAIGDTTYAAGDAVQLRPGTYAVAVSAPGFEPFNGTVDITLARDVTMLEVRLAQLIVVSAVATGDYHSIALRTDGTVWAWGDNRNGRLGDGTTTDRGTPVQVGGLNNVTSIAAGPSHSMALRADGTVWAWGWNLDGRLGVGTTTDRFTPVQVSGLSNVTSITAGDRHSLALRTDGTVWAWGLNSNGRLGDGTTTHRLSPVQVSGLNNVISIAAGETHSLALRTDGTVWAWGSNRSGRLGDGTATSRLTPVQVSGLSNVTSITAGHYHSLALRTDGTVWAWGGNYAGKLGDGTTTDRRTPVQVGGLNNVTSIAAGWHHSLALRTDGTVWAWGWNDGGRLGDGTTTDRRTPVQVSGLSNVTSIAAGQSHSMALRADGTVWAWGTNYEGRLGDGTTTDRRTPVKASGLGGPY